MDWGTIAGARASISAELAAARRLTGRPIAVNLLLPFVRPGDVEAAAAADVIVTFWGVPRRLAATTWVHQCGSVEEAKAAVRAGADAVIAQGVECENLVDWRPLYAGANVGRIADIPTATQLVSMLTS